MTKDNLRRVPRNGLPHPGNEILPREVPDSRRTGSKSSPTDLRTIPDRTSPETANVNDKYSNAKKASHETNEKLYGTQATHEESTAPLGGNYDDCIC
ncbi:MAG: hypothetical protein M3P33_01390 [bacterium]|nr:hypothetical protein [bacterium]